MLYSILGTVFMVVKLYITICTVYTWLSDKFNLICCSDYVKSLWQKVYYIDYRIWTSVYINVILAGTTGACFIQVTY